MKRFLSVVALSFALLGSVMAQDKDAQAIFDRYCDVIGVEQFNASSASNSALMEMNMDMGMAKMDMTVISEKPNKYSAKISTQGMNIEIVGDDKVAYMTTMGQTQTITDPVQIKQMLPMTNIASEIVPKVPPGTELVYKGEKDGCDMVEIKSEEGDAVVYYNIETGLIEKITTKTQGMDVEVIYSDYKKFEDGGLLIPSVMTTKVAGQKVIITIKNFETAYPTAAWMFAAPEAK